MPPKSIMERWESAKSATRDSVRNEIIDALRSPQTVLEIAKVLDEEVGHDGLQGNESLEVAQRIVALLTNPQIVVRDSSGETEGGAQDSQGDLA